MRKAIWWVVGILIVAVGGYFVVNRLRRPAFTGFHSQYAFASAATGPLEVDVTGQGTVQAAQTGNVYAERSGTVESVQGTVGQRVKAGQVLVRLTDNGATASRIATDEAQLSSDEATLYDLEHPSAANASSVAAAEGRLAADKANLHALQHPSAANASSVTAAQQRLAADEMRLTDDEAALAGLKVMAPSSGVITSLSLSIGSNVQSGATLAVIADPTSLVVQSTVPQADLTQMHVGDAAQVSGQGVNIIDGTVTAIGAEATSSGKGGGQFPVTIKLSSSSGLYAGEEVSVSLPYDYLGFSGTTAYATEVPVVAPTAATVQSVTVELGQTIQAGDLIAQLTSPTLQQQITSDKATVASDQAALSSLVSPTPPTAAQIASAEAAVASDQAALNALLSPTQAQVTADEARIATDRQTLQSDEQSLAELTITSPIAGQIAAVNVAQGDLVGAGGSAALVEIIGASGMEVVVPIDQSKITQVHPGQATSVTSDAVAGKTFAGTVLSVAPQGTNSQGVSTFNVTVFVPSPGGLKSGMAANVTIPVAKISSTLLVPSEAVTGTGAGATVQVMSGGQLTKVHVVAGLSNDVDTQIVSGLTPGQLVVTAMAASSTTQPRGGSLFRLGGGFGGGFGGGSRGSGGGGGGGSGGGSPAGGP